MKKMYQLIGEFADGGTEDFGEYETEADALERAETAYKWNISNAFSDYLTGFHLKTVIRPTGDEA